jgi:hypothetical protein
VAAGAALASGISQANANSITLDLTGLAPGSRTTPVNGALYFDVNATSAAAAVGFAPFAGADFQLTNSQGTKSVAAANNNAVVGNGVATNIGKAARFSPSNSVGPLNNFQTRATIGSNGKIGGYFNPGDTGSIGLRFAIGADTHYGWANLSLNGDYTVALNGLGYESNPDTAAHVEGLSSVPDHGSSLALLAVGAAGLLAFRSRQRQAV